MSKIYKPLIIDILMLVAIVAIIIIFPTLSKDVPDIFLHNLLHIFKIPYGFSKYLKKLLLLFLFKIKIYIWSR